MFCGNSSHLFKRLQTHKTYLNNNYQEIFKTDNNNLQNIIKKIDDLSYNIINKSKLSNNVELENLKIKNENLKLELELFKLSNNISQ